METLGKREININNIINLRILETNYRTVTAPFPHRLFNYFLSPPPQRGRRDGYDKTVCYRTVSYYRMFYYLFFTVIESGRLKQRKT